MHATLRRLPVLLSLLPGIALAHPSADHALSFAAGISHPFGGLDHLLAMVAVGVLGARLNNRAVWLLPLTFMAVLSVGALIGMHRPASPFVEPAIAASIIALGLMLVAKVPKQLFATASVIGVFALAHGYAHGTEAITGGAGFVSGMLMASAALHAAGILAVVTMRRLAHEQTEPALRMGGALLTLIGAAFMFA